VGPRRAARDNGTSTSFNQGAAREKKAERKDSLLPLSGKGGEGGNGGETFASERKKKKGSKVFLGKGGERKSTRGRASILMKRRGGGREGGKGGERRRLASHALEKKCVKKFVYRVGEDCEKGKLESVDKRKKGRKIKVTQILLPRSKGREIAWEERGKEKQWWGGEASSTLKRGEKRRGVDEKRKKGFFSRPGEKRGGTLPLSSRKKEGREH